MHESPTDGRGPRVDVAKPQRSFPSKAARYSLIVPIICGPVLFVFSKFGQDIHGAGVLFASLSIRYLFPVSLTSFLAGFVGLFSGKARDVVMATFGLLLSGVCAFFGYVLSAFL